MTDTGYQVLLDPPHIRARNLRAIIECNRLNIEMLNRAVEDEALQHHNNIQSLILELQTEDLQEELTALEENKQKYENEVF